MSKFQKVENDSDYYLCQKVYCNYKKIFPFYIFDQTFFKKIPEKSVVALVFCAKLLSARKMVLTTHAPIL